MPFLYILMTNYPLKENWYIFNEAFENNVLLSLLERINFYGFSYCKIFYYMDLPFIIKKKQNYRGKESGIK